MFADRNEYIMFKIGFKSVIMWCISLEGAILEFRDFKDHQYSWILKVKFEIFFAGLTIFLSSSPLVGLCSCRSRILISFFFEFSLSTYFIFSRCGPCLTIVSYYPYSQLCHVRSLHPTYCKRTIYSIRCFYALQIEGKRWNSSSFFWCF